MEFYVQKNSILLLQNGLHRNNALCVSVKRQTFINKSEERQINMLIYCMSDKLEDIFESFNLANDDAKEFDTVLQKFDDHFVIEKNAIFERAKFNMRCQKRGEPTELFIMTLHKLSEFCNYGLLCDKLIRDRIVAGIRNSKLPERMQLDAKLTLEKVVTMVRQSEQVHQQQDIQHSAKS